MITSVCRKRCGDNMVGGLRIDQVNLATILAWWQKNLSQLKTTSKRV